MESTLTGLVYPIRTILNLYIYALITVYFWSFLTPKEGVSSRRALLMTAGISVLGIGIGLFFYSRFVLKIVLSILNYALLCGFIYRDSLFRRLVVSLFYMILLMLAEGVQAAGVVLMSGQSLPVAAQDPAFIVKLFPVQLMVYTLTYGLPSLVARRRSKARTSIAFGQFVILPLSQIIMVGGFLYAIYAGDRTLGMMDAVITALVVVLCGITDLVFLRMVGALIQKKQLEEQQALQKHHYAALMEQQRSIRALRHDIGNHLMTAALLAREDGARAEAYLQGINQEFRALTAIDFCENTVADAVLYGKAAEAAARKVEFTVHADLSGSLSIQETDLMSLLSNLLDNALEAAVRAKEPFVEVSIRQRAGAVLIRVRNALALDARPDLEKTSKADKRMHGVGLQIVENICRRYEGSLSYQREGDIFEVTAMILDQPPG